MRLDFWHGMVVGALASVGVMGLVLIPGYNNWEWSAIGLAVTGVCRILLDDWKGL